MRSAVLAGAGLLLCSLQGASGFAYLMVDRCGTGLTPGTRIMGAPVAPTGEAVTVSRGGAPLVNGGTYTPGEQLAVSVNPPGVSSPESEVMLQVSGASFNGEGGCGGTRMAGNNAVITAPTNGGPVTVVAGWALGHSAVQVTQSFTLHPGK